MKHLKKFNESPFFGSDWGNDDNDDIGPFSHWDDDFEYGSSDLQRLNDILTTRDENFAHKQLKSFFKNLNKKSPIYSDIATAIDSWNGYKGEWQEWVEKAIEKLKSL